MTKIIEIAISQIGVQEDAAHTNHGEAVKYQIAAGLPKSGGFPWCQSFVFWCGLTAYGELNPIPLTGGVLDCYNKAKQQNYKIIEIANFKPENIKSGMQGIMDFGKGLGHTFLVESIDEDGSIHTIEGNSNPEGGRDGYEVCRRVRHLHDKLMLAFINYDYPNSK